jgi:hypothetical protein
VSPVSRGGPARTLVTYGRKNATERGMLLESVFHAQAIVDLVLSFEDTEDKQYDRWEKEERDRVFEKFVRGLVGPALSFDLPALVLREKLCVFNLLGIGEFGSTNNKEGYAFSYTGDTYTILAAVPTIVRSGADIRKAVVDTFRACPEFVPRGGRFALLGGVPKPDKPMAICRLDFDQLGGWTTIESEDGSFRQYQNDQAVDDSEDLDEWRAEMTRLTGDKDYASGLRDDEAPEDFRFDGESQNESE